MKTLIRISAVCLLAFVVPSQVYAWVPPAVKVDAGFDMWFKVKHAGQCDYRAGPWYLYFPHEAHFQTPAPVGGFYPHWPNRWANQRHAGGQQNSSHGSQNTSQGQCPCKQPEKKETDKTPTKPPVKTGTTVPYNQPLGLSPAGTPSASYNPYHYSYRNYSVPVGYSYRVPSYWYGR